MAIKLLEIKYGNLLKDMENHFDYVSKKYFRKDIKELIIKRRNGEGKIRPTFKIRSNLKEVGYYNPGSNGFVINLDFAADPEQIKAVMYHETIHYYEIAINGFSSSTYKINGYHGDYFKKKMKEINSGEGKRYVSVEGEFKSISSGKSVNPFWVYVIDKTNGNFNWFWSAKRNQKLIEVSKRMVASDQTDWKNVYLFQTDTIHFKDGPRLSAGGSKIRYGVLSKSDKKYKQFYEKEFIKTKKEML